MVLGPQVLGSGLEEDIGDAQLLPEKGLVQSADGDPPRFPSRLWRGGLGGVAEQMGSGTGCGEGGRQPGRVLPLLSASLTGPE